VPHDDDATADALAELEAATLAIAVRSQYETENRRGLLWIHSLMGLLAGVQVMLWGTAAGIELTFGVGARIVMGTLGILGGSLLAIGLMRRPRSIPLEIAGLLVVGLWDLAMTIALLTGRIDQVLGDGPLSGIHPLPLLEPQPPGYVTAYASTVYAGLCALIGVHLWTLRRLNRSGRRALWIRS
jgi:hypothetical protein